MSISQAYQRLCKFDKPFIWYWHVAFVIQKRMGYMSNISQHISSKYIYAFMHLWQMALWIYCRFKAFMREASNYDIIPSVHLCLFCTLFLWLFDLLFLQELAYIVYLVRWLPAFLKSTKHIAWAVFPFNDFEEKYTLDWCKIRSRYDLLIYVTIRTIKCVYYIQQVFYILVMMKIF